jgi:hypothetical protein
MNARKTIGILALMASFALQRAVAADLGFSLESVTGLSQGAGAAEMEFTESAKLKAYLALKAGAAFRFSAAGWGDMDYSSSDAESPFTFGGNLDYLEASASLLQAGASARLALSAGRIRRQDPFPFIGLTRFDGLSVAFSAGQLDVLAEGGYLGLLSHMNERILLSSDDASDYSDADADSAGYFAPKRIYAALRIRLVELLLGQDIVLGGTAQFDARGETADETVDSQYVELGLEGPLPAGFSYSLGGNAAFIQRAPDTETSRTAMAASADLRWSLPRAAGSAVELGALWGSGTAGTLSPFAPITSESLGTSYAGYLGSTARFQASYSLSPFAGFSASLKGAGFMRSGAEEPADADYVAGTAETWLGEEVSASLRYSILSDLFAGLSGSCFIPARGITYEADAALRWNANFSVSLRW